MSAEHKPHWGASYRLIAAEKWKAKSAAMGHDVTSALVEYACPRLGMKVLDVASGTGEPAISLAGRVGPSGHITALDVSSELLEVAEQRARSRGLTNFSTREADAHKIPANDGSFDLVTCRFGVMFFADPDLALREIFRVLKPNGRACFLAWGPFDQPYWQSTMAIVHKRVGGPLLQPDSPNMFGFAERGTLSAVLRRTGFCDVSEETRTLPWKWPGSAEEVWQYAQAVSVPFRPMLERVPQNQWDEVNAEVHAAISKYVQGDTVNFGVVVVMASGTRCL
jgi:SAM-dependent methyltransferase